MPHEFRYGVTYYIQWKLPLDPGSPVIIKHLLEFRGSDLVRKNRRWTTINRFLDRSTNEVYFISRENITYSHIEHSH